MVRPDMNWHSLLDKQLGQVIQYIMVGKAPSHPGCQTFPEILINNVQDPKWQPVVGSGLHELITPDMLGKERFQPDHRTVVKP